MTRPVSTSPFADIHGELRAVARDLLGSTSPLSSGSGTAIPLDWEKLARAGWTGLELPSEVGGAGATIAEVAVVLHEMGRTAALSPYLGTVVLGVGLLSSIAPCARRDQLLERMAVGSTRVAVAIPATDEHASGAGPAFTLSGGPGAWRVDGHAPFVPDGDEADLLMLPATDPNGEGVIVVVGTGVTGLFVTTRPVVDPTRALADVTALSVPIDDDTVLHPVRGASLDSLIGRVHERAAFAIACDSLGLAEAMVETTVAYVALRQQFGRPIGSFQAVKHACADMLIQVKVGEQLVATAAEALAAGSPDAWIAVSQAKSQVCEAAVGVCGKAMQLHGGIGYTWELGVHAYLKRSALNRSLFGSPYAHRRRLAGRYRKDRS